MQFSSLWMVAQSPKDVPHVDITISGDLLGGSAKVLELLFGWKDVVLNQCTDGITNKLVQAKCGSQTVLVRIYGKKSEILIDRNQELVNLQILSKEGLCPPLYGKFNNGLVYGYVPGQVFTVQDMSDHKKSLLVAKKLRTWHETSLPGNRVPQLFVTMRKWINAIPKQFSDPLKQQAFLESKLDPQALEQELLVLQEKLEQLNSPVVFCHNDLLSGNIIYDQDDVHFIDYEYGCYSYRGFDIGNHFCEFGGFDCDWSKYPSDAFVEQWLLGYFGEDVDIEQMIREVHLFSLAAHFFWSLWALVQAEISEIDFDYLQYAQNRMTEYHLKKTVWL
ncbi:kinase-like domain-containing protein [Gorgonomyces haynaldii]|nr:kinase-like domain-containing protein [Gorgonomyces haynaldii]